MSANENHRSGRISLGVLGLAVVVVAAIGVAAWFIVNQKEPVPEKGKVPDSPSVHLSAADCEKSNSQLNEAVGNLESGAYSKADQALAGLARMFPQEPAAVRNLAICRTLAVTDSKPEPAFADPAVALPAIEAARLLEPNSPVPYLLSSRIAAKREDPDAAVAELEKAQRLAPNEAVIAYEIYNVASAVPTDDVLRRKSREALATALKHDPSNSYLLKQQLVAQAEERDSQALETLKTLRATIETILPAVKQNTRADFDEIAAQLKAAIADEKWPQARSRALVINNIILSDEWVRSDLRRLKRHPLAYVVLSFSPAVCGDTDAAIARNDSRIEVHLAPLPAERQFPELTGVTHINVSDVDLDGTPDVLALTERELTVLARSGPAESWKNVLSVPVREPMRGLLVADLDRDENVHVKPIVERGAAGAKPQAKLDARAVKDEGATGKVACQPGDVDVVVFGPAGVQIFRNDVDDTGKRTFLPVEQTPEFEALRDVLAGVLADIDHDGDLDLVLSAKAGISVWANLGQLKFSEITKRSAMPAPELAATSLVAVDWDRDLDTDILIAGPTDSPAGWLENLRHGALRWRSFAGDLAGLNGSASLNVAEVDGNASWDVIAGGSKGLHLARTRTPYPGDVQPLDFTKISSEPVMRSIVGDFDNDTHPDLVAWGEAGLAMFWGSSAAQFQAAEGIVSSPPAKVAACAAADLDGDGDLDLVVADAEKLVLYDNVGGNRNHWLAVRVMGQTGDNQNTGDVNHLGLGSVLELKTGRQYQAQIVTGQVTHFGLGQRKNADVLRVVWTNGVPQPAVAPSADATVCKVHQILSSCPYFYTWNGREFVFCTDACWAAPLGLQLAEGVFAEPRAWEYLTIPPGRLVPKDGQYLVQMTEELWEATYLDRMELVVVDHPADVQIFSNEKVGPPELAEFKVHTVRNARLPLAARDKHGRDVLPDIRSEDGVFMKGFDNQERRGLVDEHFLELDLGPLAQPRNVTLFLTGWLYPASTSLRLGVSQDPLAPAPRPPALLVPDEHGSWQVAREFMGFPGGRTKTIAVDISDVFLTNDFRLRIVTNMEFCWDAVFFSVDEDPAPFQLTRLSVASADLHYRGFSAIIRKSGFGPDGYDYNRVGIAPKWAPMSGLFTRYGDVTELLQQDDDLSVVFGSGDELSVAFDAPANDPPAGWKRDFLLHNVGWDKDNDLNVVTSQAVEPLPFQGMSGYPYRADEAFPDTPRHREYLRKFQTRTQQQIEFWRQTQRFRD
jgi:tetratricopeptide (TPR) repeat protein